MSLPNSKKEALALGEMFFDTGKPCIYGHRSKRYTASRRCVACDNARRGTTTYKEKKAIYWESTRDQQLHRRCKRVYGVDKGEMKRSQDFKCAICKLPFKSIRNGCNVDHNHETGKVRGLLCQGCNTGLGGFMEDPEIMLSAINYILKYR